MIASPSKLLQKYFIEEGYGNDPPHLTRPIYVGFMPGTSLVPANAIAIYDPTGTKDGRIMKTGEVISHPGIQVRVRASTYPVAYDKIRSMALRLDIISRRSIIIDDQTYAIMNVTRTGDPISLGLEEATNRVLFVVNSRVTISGGPTV